ncbi:MAG TPA: carboxypeptidase-like regulatory domain-containing protein [Vicinamibacterales bacterium]|jgi:hypothetical protein
MLRQSIAAACLCAAALTPASAQEVRQTIRIEASGGDAGPISFLPPGREAKKGTSGLKGRIVGSDAGSPLRRAQVRINGPDIGSKTTLTDAQGQYEFRELPAGRFTLTITKSGYVTMQYGQSRPFEPGRPIELADAQLLDKIDVALPRGSVLAGRVVDEFGETVADADVTAMRLQYQNGRRRLVATGRNASTNDLGQFRIYGLPPGEYYVSATLRNMTMMAMDLVGGGAAGANSQTSGYASTYYPSTPNAGEAQRVSVAIGQELTTVDIQLQPVKLARVSGAAIGSDGKPMGGAIVMLMSSAKDALMFGPGATTRTDKDGNFTLTGVTPGEYSLQAQSSGGMFQSTAGGNVMAFAFTMSDSPAAGPGAGEPQQREFATASVSVAGEDLTGLVLMGTRGAKVSGRIVFEGGANPDGVTGIRVTTPSTDADAGPTPTFGLGQVKDGGVFDIDSLVGGHTFRAVNLPRGWMLKRVMLNGEDVTDRGVDFKPGADVNGIDIELTNRLTSIAGTVSAATGQPVKSYTVVVFPVDEQKWALPQNRWTASTRPNQDGEFKLASLPPGEYYAAAVEYVAQGDWQDPEWLARAAKTATRFALDEGASKTLELKLSGS